MLPNKIKDNKMEYDHEQWLRSQRRKCQKCGDSESMMRVVNYVDASTLAEKEVNGFIYKAWPYYECKRHGLQVAM